MNVTQAITQVLARTDNVPPTAAENATRRERLLEYLIEEFEDLYDDDWKFRRRSATVTASAGNGYGLLPTDFGALGKFGSVWLQRGGLDIHQLEEEPESYIDQLRRAGGETDDPHVFSIFGQDDTTFQLKLQIPKNTSALSFSIYYLRAAPTLDESANVDNLKYIPVRWHQAVLIPRLRARAREAKGDVRWKNDERKADRNMVKMKGELMRDQGRFRQLNSFFDGWR